MKSSGFTIIEILVVMAIIAVIASFGMILSQDFFRSYTFRSETSALVSVLSKARTQAISNINQQPHGVRVEPGQYIIFQGSTFDPSDPNNFAVKTQPAVTNNGPATIIFSQVSGDVATPTTIILTGDGHTAAVKVNSAGRIDW
ncbi:MAG: Tfp pilus assembly protein FimT/FimU [Acidobacteriaceae bacterium]